MKKKKESKEVQVVEAQLPQTTSELIETAVSKGGDLEKVSKLLDIKIQWEKNEARKAYHKAMSEFKANPPKIGKDRTVKFKDVKYKHASLYNVADKINTALSQHGLSAAWLTNQVNGTISVTCVITHMLGHSERTVLTASPDTTGSKNAIQAMASAVSYLQRYTLLSLTGLATFEEDDDGQATSGKLISPEQKDILLDMITDTNAKIDKVLEFMGVDALDKIPASDYNKAFAALAARKKVKKA